MEARKKVMKFGGSSAANEDQWNKVVKIVGSQSGVVVVSAMQGMTDDLLAIIKEPRSSKKAEAGWHQIYQRIFECVRKLDIASVQNEMILTRAGRAWEAYLSGGQSDLLLSIGEIVNAMIGAAIIPGAKYLEATECLVINDKGEVDTEASYKRIVEVVDQDRSGIYIMGGFHGVTADGAVRVLGRGGSDETAAHMAAALLWPCEIWTDASGILTADPRIVGHGVAKTIARLTYAEAGELAMRGAKVLYRNAVDPVAKVGVPMWIKNTNDPEALGTLISNTGGNNGPVTGIAGLKDPVTIFTLRATEDDLGLGSKALTVLEESGLTWDHIGSAWRAFSVTVTSDQLNDDTMDRISVELRSVTGAEVKIAFKEICLIAIIGEGIGTDPSIMHRLYAALAGVQVPSGMITQAFGCPSHTLGVPKEMYNTAIKAIHHAFFGGEA